MIPAGSSTPAGAFDIEKPFGTATGNSENVYVYG